jgi:AMMECR1 domain-containing protein
MIIIGSSLTVQYLFNILFSPLFVTWEKLNGGEWRLRGCIGNFEPMPIHEGIAEYALVSAFRDSRFRKIDKSELEDLRCG